MPEMTLVEAVNLALARAMEEDPDVVVLGEDVGINGGVFRATVGLQQRFGSERVIDTPLSELLISGLCVGMAAQGLKPVGEIQFMGFLYPCIDQLVNHASRLRNRTQGRLSCPMVLRTPHGGGIRAPEHHSESTEAMLAHIPGLRVVIPSSPERAYGLLLAAIRDPDPVVFLEPTRLYRAAKVEVEDSGEALPLDVAFVLREGQDVTLISWGAMVKETLAAAEELAADGIDAEVIDLATLKPYDEETVLASVTKTGRCVIVHEAARTGGFGAEIAAFIAERGLTSLLAPVAPGHRLRYGHAASAPRATLYAVGGPHRRRRTQACGSLNLTGKLPCANSCCRISAKASKKPKSSPGTSTRAITSSSISRSCRSRPTRPWSRSPRRQSGRIARLFGAKGDLVKVGRAAGRIRRGGREQDTGTVVGELGRTRRRAAASRGTSRACAGARAAGASGGQGAGTQARRRSQPRSGQRPRRHDHTRGRRARRQEPGRRGAGGAAAWDAARDGATDGGGARRSGARQP